MITLYNHLGQLVRRRAGFDRSLENVSDLDLDSSIDVIGSEASYYSETEEKWIDRMNSDNRKTTGKMQ